jgi:short-subunit dehydrogenase
MISSVSALRGMPRGMTTYAATKAAVAHLAEGFRADVHGTPIKVTVLYPGYIESEMSGSASRTPLMTTTEKGVRAMVEAIEKEKASARVPAWPWVPVGFVIKHAPAGLLRRMS